MEACAEGTPALLSWLATVFLATSVGDTLVDAGSVADHILDGYFLVLSRWVILRYEQLPCAVFVSLFLFFFLFPS
jgi:hypothetical protein